MKERVKLSVGQARAIFSLVAEKQRVVNEVDASVGELMSAFALAHQLPKGAFSLEQEGQDVFLASDCEEPEGQP